MAYLRHKPPPPWPHTLLHILVIVSNSRNFRGYGVYIEVAGSSIGIWYLQWCFLNFVQDMAGDDKTYSEPTTESAFNHIQGREMGRLCWSDGDLPHKHACSSCSSRALFSDSAATPEGGCSGARPLGLWETLFFAQLAWTAASIRSAPACLSREEQRRHDLT